MRAWDIWLAILLFTVGGGCLVASVHAVPVGSVSGWVPLLQAIRVGLLIFLSFVFVWFLWRDLQSRRSSGYCGGCGIRLVAEWNYCPKCGKTIRKELVPSPKDSKPEGRDG